MTDPINQPAAELPERIWLSRHYPCLYRLEQSSTEDVAYVPDTRHQPPAAPLDARERAREIVENWHNGYRYVARFNIQDQCANDLIDAIAAALTTTPAASGPLPHADRLESFKKLERGWDSYNSAPIDPQAIEIATYLSPFLADWDVVPRSDGMIQFEKGWAEICIDTFDPSTDKLATNAATGAQTCPHLRQTFPDTPAVNRCLDCGELLHCEFPATTTAAEQSMADQVENRRVQIQLIHEKYQDWYKAVSGGSDSTAMVLMMTDIRYLLHLVGGIK